MPKFFAIETPPIAPPENYDRNLHASILVGEHLFLVDRDDLPHVASREWFVSASGYLTTKGEDGRFELFHRWTMQHSFQPHMKVDHRNRLKSDNRKCNLRWVHPSLNNHNSTRVNESGYLGVVFKRGAYEAGINFNYQGFYLGRFQNPEDAARARDLKAVEIYGADARTNFDISLYPIPKETLVSKLSARPTKRRTKPQCVWADCPEPSRGALNLCAKHGKRFLEHQAKLANGQAITPYAERVDITFERCPHHPDRMVFARNLCAACWRAERKAEGYQRVPIIKPRCAEGDGKHGLHRVGEKQWLCRTHFLESQGKTPGSGRTGRPKTPKVSCTTDGCPEMGSAKTGLCPRCYRQRWQAAKKKKAETNT